MRELAPDFAAQIDRLDPLRVALDVQLVATRGQVHLEGALDAPQVLVVRSEEGVETLLGEGDLGHGFSFFPGWFFDGCGDRTVSARDGRLHERSTGGRPGATESSRERARPSAHLRT